MYQTDSKLLVAKKISFKLRYKFLRVQDTEKYCERLQSSTRPTFFSPPPINACGAIVNSKKRKEKSGDCAVDSARGARACDRSTVTRREREIRACDEHERISGYLRKKIYCSLGTRISREAKVEDRGKKRERIPSPRIKFANIFAQQRSPID